jgi:hypothetical protein
MSICACSCHWQWRNACYNVLKSSRLGEAAGPALAPVTTTALHFGSELLTNIHRIVLPWLHLADAMVGSAAGSRATQGFCDDSVNNMSLADPITGTVRVPAHASRPFNIGQLEYPLSSVLWVVRQRLYDALSQSICERYGDVFSTSLRGVRHVASTDVYTSALFSAARTTLECLMLVLCYDGDGALDPARSVCSPTEVLDLLRSVGSQKEICEV